MRCNYFYKGYILSFVMEDKGEVRRLEEKVKLRLILNEDWTPVEGNQFRGYLFKVIDGVKKYSAPDGFGGYYVRGS